MIDPKTKVVFVAECEDSHLSIGVALCPRLANFTFSLLVRHLQVEPEKIAVLLAATEMFALMCWVKWLPYCCH